MFAWIKNVHALQQGKLLRPSNIMVLSWIYNEDNFGDAMV